MEFIIEPLELVVGLSSGDGENGFSVLMEAAKRFQVNVTPSFSRTYRAMMDAMTEKFNRTVYKRTRTANVTQ